MSDRGSDSLAWVFAVLVLVAGAAAFGGVAIGQAADDHDTARVLRERGTVMPLADVLRHPTLQGLRVLEADLEDEHGRMVYELELLDGSGRVHKRYFDAALGQPLQEGLGD